MTTKKRQKQLNKNRKKRKLEHAPLVNMPADPTVNIPKVNYHAWLKAITNREPRVWDSIIDYLLFFERNHYKSFGANALISLNEFGTCVYAALMDEEFMPNNEQAVKMIQTGHLFQHLMAISAHRTNDAYVKSTLLQKGNVVKLLFLLNPRCEFQVDQAKLFEAEPFLASLWFNTYLLGVSTPTKTLQTNIYRHLRLMDARWAPPHHCLTGLYFTCTYHNPESAKRVKGIINKGIKQKGVPTFNNNPDPNSIAIITNKWHRNHAVYKSASPLVEQLKGKYNLTLIWTSRPENMPSTIVKEYFDTVENCYFEANGQLIIPDVLRNNNFKMIYFPDIGMSDESVWLSNCRIAPIQAMGYGHPETTGDGSEIDYFIGGDVEKESVEDYSETMVLLPGLAQQPAWPTAERKYNYKDDGIVRVNCVWGPDKYNYTLLSMLAEINNQVWQKDAQSKHEIHLFASPGVNRYAALPVFMSDIAQILPNAVVHSEQEYYDYMENAEMHDFSLNSFPFGCYNTLVESLYLGLPFLTLVGDRFYNRAGMWLNEQVDMGYNNHYLPRTLIEGAVELITEPGELRRQREHLASIDLRECLFTLKGNHFLEAVEYIMENHPFNETKIVGSNT